MWSQRFGGSEQETLDAFDVDSSGNVITTGNFGGTATFETFDSGDPSRLAGTLNQNYRTSSFSNSTRLTALQLGQAIAGSGHQPSRTSTSTPGRFPGREGGAVSAQRTTYNDSILVRMDVEMDSVRSMHPWFINTVEQLLLRH